MISKSIGNSLLALALAGLGACRDKVADAGAHEIAKPATNHSSGAREASGSDDTGGLEPPPERDDDPRAPALVIARSPSPATVAGQGTKSLGFRLDKITHLFALAATAKLPEWGAAGRGEPKLARDDDLDTAWQCEFGGAKPCVLGLALPEQAKVEAVRMYVAAGPRYREYTGHPRVAKVRVHTEAGHVDAELPDGANHVYVRFDAPIATQVLAIEVLGVHAGKDDAQIHLAEIEIFGTDGMPRQPIELDPDYAWLSWETTTWAASGDDHAIRQVFVNFAQPGAAIRTDGMPKPPPPRSRRLLRATAVFGQVGDDYLLFERLHGTDCAETRGSYVLFDRRNRMFYPLGDLGGAGAPVYRHAAGRGFAVGWVDDGLFTAKGVAEEAGELVWKRPPKLAPDDGEALLREWGFETEPLARAQPLTAAIPGCHRAALDELDALVDVAKFGGARVEDPADWIICDVGGDTLYASAPCGEPARAYQIAANKLIGKHEGKHDDARGLRLRRVGDRVLLELSAERGDTSTLLWAEPGQLVELGAHAGLFVRPPSTCSECDDEWPDPALAIDEFAGDGEPWRDEGWGDDELDEDAVDDPIDASPLPLPLPPPPT